MSCSLKTVLPCGFSITGTGSYSCSSCNEIQTDTLYPKINFSCEQNSGITQSSAITRPIPFEIYVGIPVAVAVILIIFFCYFVYND